jgi:two-component system sensor histidine kinase BaeS
MGRARSLIKRSLTLKLTLAFMAVSLTGIALVALLVWGITLTEFNRFMQDRALTDFATAATSYYQAHGSWEGVEAALHQQGLIPTAGQPQAGGGNNPPPPPIALTDAQGQVIIAAGLFHQGAQAPLTASQQKIAITVKNQVVGYVQMAGGPPRPDPIEARYLARTDQALVLAALGAVIIAVLLGLFLARTITRPVRDLTAATRALAEGRPNQQVQVRSQDELGELTKTFNKMSADLENAKALRRQMTADIAHDLRTPLAVITGYLEGLKDGVIKPSPKRFMAMHDEALFLQRLVEDLRTLSLADAGELSLVLQPIRPGELVARLAASYQHQAEQKSVRLTVSIEPDLPAINADPERMQQALSNLVSNAMRFTPAGGEICLLARQEGHVVWMEVSDTGSGIDPQVLPHVFERFYQGDNSRQEGGSGLGLAIARSIIELQGGKISAASSGVGAGSLFSIQMPC